MALEPIVSAGIFGLQPLQTVAHLFPLLSPKSDFLTAFFPSDQGALTLAQKPLILGTSGGAYLKIVIHDSPSPEEWPHIEGKQTPCQSCKY